MSTVRGYNFLYTHSYNCPRENHVGYADGNHARVIDVVGDSTVSNHELIATLGLAPSNRSKNPRRTHQLRARSALQQASTLLELPSIPAAALDCRMRMRSWAWLVVGWLWVDAWRISLSRLFESRFA